jgi:hypothetical protein
VLGRQPTIKEQFGMAVAHDAAVASSAAQWTLGAVANSNAVKAAAGAATAVGLWYLDVQPKDALAQAKGESADSAVAAYKAMARGAAGPLATGVAIAISGLLALALANRVVGLSTHCGRLAALAEIQEMLSTEQEQRLIELFDGLRDSLKDEASIKALGPNLLEALPLLCSLFDPSGGWALEELQCSHRLNVALGLTDSQAVASFWAARRAECLYAAAPSSG